MTDDHMHEDEEDALDILAAEYAMRLLSGEEHKSAQQRLAHDPDFAQAVTAWEIRLAQLTDDLPSQAPSPLVKRALLADLFPASARPSFWSGVRVWQAISALSLVAVAILGISGFLGQPDGGGPLYTAEIVAESGDFRVIAVVDKIANEITLTRTLGSAPEGRILQVWAHGPDAPAQSVGLWPEGETVRLPLPAEIAAVEGVLTVGVSEEPVGGSPTGTPSGRVFGTVDIPGVSGRT